MRLLYCLWCNFINLLGYRGRGVGPNRENHPKAQRFRYSERVCSHKPYKTLCEVRIAKIPNNEPHRHSDYEQLFGGSTESVWVSEVDRVRLGRQQTSNFGACACMSSVRREFQRVIKKRKNFFFFIKIIFIFFKEKPWEIWK